MTIKEIFPQLMILGIFLGVFFIVFTLFSKRRKDKPVVYLQLVALFLTLHNLQVYYSIDNVDTNILEQKLLLPWYALIIPAFYSFVLYYLKLENKKKKYFQIALYLFATEVLVRIGLIPNHFHDVKNLKIANYAQFEEILNAGFTIFLFVKTFLLYKQKSKKLDFILSFDKLRWLNQFMILAIVVILTWVFAIIFNLKNVLNPDVDLYYPLRLSTTFLLCWIAYIGFFRYNLIVDRQEIREIFAETIVHDIVKESNDVTVLDKDFLKIKNFIYLEKNYLNPNLSIEQVADETKINSRNITQILQEATNFNFPDYINSLRIQKAKKFLVSARYSKYTVVSIGLECGFNSKSTFYRAFKKATGTTPTEFRFENHK